MWSLIKFISVFFFNYRRLAIWHMTFDHDLDPGNLNFVPNSPSHFVLSFWKVWKFISVVFSYHWHMVCKRTDRWMQCAITVRDCLKQAPKVRVKLLAEGRFLLNTGWFTFKILLWDMRCWPFTTGFCFGGLQVRFELCIPSPRCVCVLGGRGGGVLKNQWVSSQ